MIFYCEWQDRGPAQLLAVTLTSAPSAHRSNGPGPIHKKRISSFRQRYFRSLISKVVNGSISCISDLNQSWIWLIDGPPRTCEKRNGSLHKPPNLDEQLFATLLSLLNSGKDLRKPIITMLISVIHSSDGLPMRRKQLLARSPASNVVIGRNISGVEGGGVAPVRSDSNDGRENDKQINVIIQVRRFHS